MAGLAASSGAGVTSANGDPALKLDHGRFYPLNHPKQVQFDKGVMEFIVKDLQPLSSLSGPGFR